FLNNTILFRGGPNFDDLSGDSSVSSYYSPNIKTKDRQETIECIGWVEADCGIVIDANTCVCRERRIVCDGNVQAERIDKGSWVLPTVGVQVHIAAQETHWILADEAL